MLSIFIMLFIAIGIAAGIGYAIVTLINTAQTSLTMQSNQVRLQNISTAVRSGLTTDGGNVLLPISIDDDGRIIARLPSASPFTTTTNGSQIVYCPAFPGVGSGNSMVNDFKDGGSEEFDVTVSEFPSPDTKYITAGHARGIEGPTLTRLNKMGVIAYLLSPQPNYKGALKCGDIELASDEYTMLIDGGTVMPIYTVTTDARSSVFVLSSDGVTPSGYNGTDRVVRKLSDVTNFVKQYQIADVTVKFPSSIDVIGLDEFAAFLQTGDSRNIRLVPEQNVTHATIELKSDDVPNRNVYLATKGNLVLSGITLDGDGFDVAIDAGATSNVSLIDSQVAALKSSGGRISTEGDTRIVPADGFDTVLQPVQAEGGLITIRSSAPIAIDGSESVNMFYANGGTINLASGLRVQANPVHTLTSQLFLNENGGKTVVTAASTGQTPFLSVKRQAGYLNEEIKASTFSTRQQIVMTCASGAADCTATCPVGKQVVTGYCNASNGGHIASFGPNSEETAFTCAFGGLVTMPAQPRVTAACDFR